MKALALLIPFLATSLVTRELSAQALETGVTSLVTIGSPAEDSVRLAQLSGRADAAGFLLRSPSTLGPPPPPTAGVTRVSLIAPELRVVGNSSLPSSLNQGALWAGRGWNTMLMTGVRVDRENLSIVLAPQFAYSENRDFQILPSRVDDRSTFASPWYNGAHSMDLPIRFGNQTRTVADLGQSSVTYSHAGVAAGAATENQWWGPGIRNAIVLSNNAPGFPHLFVRTAHPLDTRVGSFEAKWILGGLTESLFFDGNPDNDLRSLNAAILTYSPAIQPDLTLGIIRSLVGNASGVGDLPGHAADVLTEWRPEDGVDQITSLFFRWILPAAGLETYAEWARAEIPMNVREFLTAPYHTQGYTVGLQLAQPIAGDATVRFQAEATSLEATSTYRFGAPPPSFYVGRNVEQGYTQRGRVIGASIGPGSSSQWLAVDYLRHGWMLGLFGGRIRWETDTYYRQRTGVSFFAHDVSLLGGLRLRAPVHHADLSLRLTAAQRYNYLFQSHGGGYGRSNVYDVPNFTLGVRISPRVPRSP